MIYYIESPSAEAVFDLIKLNKFYKKLFRYTKRQILETESYANPNLKKDLREMLNTKFKGLDFKTWKGISKDNKIKAVTKDIFKIMFDLAYIHYSLS